MVPCKVFEDEKRKKQRMWRKTIIRNVFIVKIIMTNFVYYLFIILLCYILCFFLSFFKLSHQIYINILTKIHSNTHNKQTHKKKTPLVGSKRHVWRGLERSGGLEKWWKKSVVSGPFITALLIQWVNRDESIINTTITKL